MIIVQCDPATTCSGHGTCEEDGSCKCFVGFYGYSCSSKYTFGLYLFSLDFWNVEFEKSSLNLIFAGYTHSKNQVHKKIDFINSVFQTWNCHINRLGLTLLIPNFGIWVLKVLPSHSSDTRGGGRPRVVPPTPQLIT